MADADKSAREPRRKSTGATDADSLFRLVTRLIDAGHSPRRIRVGEVEVELGNRPVRTSAEVDDRPAPTYAQRALDKRARELLRHGGITDPNGNGRS